MLFGCGRTDVYATSTAASRVTSKPSRVELALGQVTRAVVVGLVLSGLASLLIHVEELILAVRTMMAYPCGARDYTHAFFKKGQREQLVQELIQATSIEDPKLYDKLKGRLLARTAVSSC